tara:strand:- start:143 stop:913 length:771 start_codon:yes stop_codon:yes gene_type:complete
MINTTKEEISQKENILKYRNKEKVNSSFLLVIENKKGKLMGLSATLNEDGDIDLYGISKGGYKILKTVKKEALINNDRVKAVYGNTHTAIEMQKLISSNGLDKKQVVEMAKNIKNGSVSNNASSEIEDFVLSKIEQGIEEKRKNIAKINKERLENKALLFYKEESGKNRFVSVTKIEDKYYIENTDKHITSQEIIENQNIKGVFGNSELAEEMRKLFKNPQYEIVNREDNDKTIEDIHSFFKDKEKKVRKNSLKRK